MSDELKDCPFCGGEAGAGTGTDAWQKRYIESVACLSCGAKIRTLTGDCERHPPTAVAAWNRRADLAAPAAPENPCPLCDGHGTAPTWVGGAAEVPAAPAVQEPFAYFQRNRGWNTWEEVIPSAAGEPGVVAAYAAPVPAIPPEYCPHCGGTGEITMMSDGGPDAHEVPAVCPDCEGHQTLEAAYKGVVARLNAERTKYLELCAKQYIEPDWKDLFEKRTRERDAIRARLDKYEKDDVVMPLAAAPQPAQQWSCGARKNSSPEPVDCDWPMCGCDPHADKVIAALQESGALSAVPQDVKDAYMRGLKDAREAASNADNLNISDVQAKGIYRAVAMIDEKIDAALAQSAEAGKGEA